MARRNEIGMEISHWYQLLDGLQLRPSEFYNTLSPMIQARQIPGIQFSMVAWREGGPLSAKREYLRIQRGEYVFDICGAPFGRGFFVSTWLHEMTGCLGDLADLTLVGFIFKNFLRPLTYYRIDTALMFQSAVHAAVLEVIDGLMSQRGLRALTEAERKPILREFYSR